jgi:hypothetical protein
MGTRTYTNNGAIKFLANGAITIEGAGGNFHKGFWDKDHLISQCNNQTEGWSHVFGNYLTSTPFGQDLDSLGTYIFAFQGGSTADITVAGAHIAGIDNTYRTGNTVEGLNLYAKSSFLALGSENFKGLNLFADGKDNSSNYGIYIDAGTYDWSMNWTNWSSGYGIYSKAKIASTNNIIAYVSDKRLKEDLKIIDNPIDKIKSLEGITFTWNDKSVNNRRGERDVGLIAQDVQKVLPEAIELFQHDKEEIKNGALAGDLLNIQYQKLTALLIEGIKEQQEQIEFLQERVTILEKDIRE